MHRTLIVARFDANDADTVAEIFEESDRTELPLLMGASSRTLFRFHDLYMHLIEAPQEIEVARFVNHPLFAEVNAKLHDHIKPYDPAWQRPSDAFATPFYTWQA